MIEINNKTQSQIDVDLVRKVVGIFLKENKIKDDVSLAFVGDTTIRALNKKYRKKDKITDVLSFEGEEGYFGEIIIDYQQIRRQAKKYSSSSREELVFILVHALYHLLGYDDKTERGHKEMEILGKYFIKKHKLK